MSVLGTPSRDILRSIFAHEKSKVEATPKITDSIYLGGKHLIKHDILPSQDFTYKKHPPRVQSTIKSQLEIDRNKANILAANERYRYIQDLLVRLITMHTREIKTTKNAWKLITEELLNIARSDIRIYSSVLSPSHLCEILHIMRVCKPSRYQYISTSFFDLISEKCMYMTASHAGTILYELSLIGVLNQVSTHVLDTLRDKVFDQKNEVIPVPLLVRALFSLCTLPYERLAPVVNSGVHILEADDLPTDCKCMYMYAQIHIVNHQNVQADRTESIRERLKRSIILEDLVKELSPFCMCTYGVCLMRCKLLRFQDGIIQTQNTPICDDFVKAMNLEFIPFLTPKLICESLCTLRILGANDFPWLEDIYRRVFNRARQISNSQWEIIQSSRPFDISTGSGKRLDLLQLLTTHGIVKKNFMHNRYSE